MTDERTKYEVAQELAQLAYEAVEPEIQDRFIRLGTLFSQLAQIEVQKELFSVTEQALRVGDPVSEESKSWQDAEEGEIWALTTRGVEETWTVQDGLFRATDGHYIRMPLDNSIITAGRLLWPTYE